MNVHNVKNMVPTIKPQNFLPKFQKLLLQPSMIICSITYFSKRYQSRLYSPISNLECMTVKFSNMKQLEQLSDGEICFDE
ncbi:hypothetical protein E1A91_A05G144200v1 [Gossypium mustelinum]|uniref:Uncharacterized protein n=1 Tax=Gossypium mustelinum TaxID=34275 RepID=A0A5D2Z5M3_GOSMU|nr:hypothetical protein E1A91_A05G144200v1 [Gossypium mustelinum]